MQDFLFSVGLPIVKTEFLRQAIKCCLSQSYENIEIIIINNGKTIEIRESIRFIVSEYSDKRIKYYENENQIPIVENWNKTLKLSNGALYSLLCDDDIWQPDFISEIVKLKSKYPLCKVFHTRVIIINENGTPINISPLCNEFEDGIDFIWHRLMGFREQYLSDFVADREEMIKNGGFFDLPNAWGSDDITWFNLACIGGIAYSNQPLFFYRESSVNITNTISLNSKFYANELYEKKVYEICQKQDNSLLKMKVIGMIYNHLNFKNRSLCLNLLKNYSVPNPIVDFILYFIYKPLFHLKYKNLDSIIQR